MRSTGSSGAGGGRGGAGGLGRKTLAGLRSLGIEPLAFVDNNSALWGTKLGGVPVLSVADGARQYCHSAAFVITIWKGEAVDRMADHRKQLLDLGCARVVSFGPLFWKYPATFTPHYAFDVPHKVCEEAEDARRALGLWADEASRREYLAQLKWRLLHDFDCLPSPVDHPTYFPPELTQGGPEEIFVDCGAYDGDTLRVLIRKSGGSFRGAIAFEPDPESFARLRQFVMGLPRALSDKIEIHQLAVGGRHEVVRFQGGGTEASAVGAGTMEVESVALDEIIGDRSPTYVKMDVEGSEPDALSGAGRLIARCAPVLAVCAYHRQDHLWRIPLLIASMSDRCRFYLRPHLLEVWDLVCYALPVDQLGS